MNIKGIAAAVGAPQATAVQAVGVAGDHCRDRVYLAHAGIAGDGNDPGADHVGERYRHRPVTAGRALGHPYLHPGLAAAAALRAHQGPAQAKSLHRQRFPEGAGGYRRQVEMAVPGSQAAVSGDDVAARHRVGDRLLMGDLAVAQKHRLHLAVAAHGDVALAGGAGHISFPAAEIKAGVGDGAHGDHSGAVIHAAGRIEVDDASPDGVDIQYKLAQKAGTDRLVAVD